MDSWGRQQQSTGFYEALASPRPRREKRRVGAKTLASSAKRGRSIGEQFSLGGFYQFLPITGEGE